MKVNPMVLAHAAQQLHYHNKQQEIRAQEEHLRQEHMQLKKLREARTREDNEIRGQNVDITV